jgi:hypothetical protein
MDINRLRDQTHMPSTLSRVQFDKWTATKLPDDLLTDSQMDIVLHFTDILYTEFHMEIEMRTFEDKSTILHHLHQVNPQDAEVITQADHDPFPAHIISELQRLLDKVVALTHTLSRRPRPATNWIGRLSEANFRLVDLIHTDMPVTSIAPPVSIPLDELPSGTPRSRRKKGTRTQRPRRSVPTAQDILADPTYHETSVISDAGNTYTEQAVHLGRVDGSPAMHPPDSTLSETITSRTHADQYTFWGQYLMVVGFYPSNTIDKTLKDLHYTVARIGIDVDSRTNHPRYHNSLYVDEQWVRDNYFTHRWAIQRNQQDARPSGFLIKLARPALFGNFLLTNAYNGTIVPRSYTIRSGEHTTRTYLFMAIPVHVPMKTIRLAERYLPILAVRSLPFEKDRHALTNGGLTTLHIVIDEVIPD